MEAAKPHTAGEPEGPYELTVGESAMLLQHAMDPSRASCNLHCALVLRSDLDCARLQHAAYAVVSKHPQLRSYFATSRQGTRRLVTAEIDRAPVHISQAREGSAEAQSAWLERQALAPFELNQAPLARFGLLLPAPLANAQVRAPVLAITLHHLIADYRSVQVIIAGLELAYSNPQTVANDKELDNEHRADLQAERRFLTSDDADLARRWWREQLADAPARLPFLGGENLEQPRRGGIGRVEYRRLGPTTVGALTAYARARAATPFLVAMAAYAKALQAVTGQRDMVIGTTVDPRRTAKVCYRVNTLPLRITLAHDASMESVLAQVSGVFREAFVHRHLPFAEIARQLPRDSTVMRPRSPHQTLFSWLRHEPWFCEAATDDRLCTETLQPSPPHAVPITHELVVVNELHGEEILCTWSYDRDGVSQSTVAAVADAYEHVLSALVP